MFDQETIKQIALTAETLGVEPAVLLAVAEVESNGRAHALIEGRREPLIRFEGHYFDRHLTLAKRAIARKQGLASPRPGAVVNPRSQAGRWKLLESARAIDVHAAYESVSWGVGQVMGAHWQSLKYVSVEDFVQEVRKDISGQVEAMARFIRHFGLSAALGTHDWRTFARGYNGPNFRRYNYDSKLAKAYVRHSAGQNRV
jgi:hypothetical protein